MSDPLETLYSTWEEGYGDQKDRAEKAERELKTAHEDREFLFQLLDDIDTMDDAAKGDDGAFRAQVRRIHKKRFERATTDGYVVKWG